MRFGFALILSCLIYVQRASVVKPKIRANSVLYTLADIDDIRAYRHARQQFV